MAKNTKKPEAVRGGVQPRVLVKDHIADRITAGAVVMAGCATAIARDREWKPELEGHFGEAGEHKVATGRMREQVIGAVMLSVASMEGLLNEILSDASDHLDGRMGTTAPPNITTEAYRRWGHLWKTTRVLSRGDLLNRCDIALQVADLPALENDPLRDNVAVLIELRNQLTHSVPRFRPHGPRVLQNDRDPLERKLLGRFAPSPMVSPHAPFFWQRCLGPGCAQWAVDTDHDFTRRIFEVFGVPTKVGHIDWDKPSTLLSSVLPMPANLRRTQLQQRRRRSS